MTATLTGPEVQKFAETTEHTFQSLVRKFTPNKAYGLSPRFETFIASLFEQEEWQYAVFLPILRKGDRVWMGGDDSYSMKQLRAMLNCHKEHLHLTDAESFLFEDIFDAWFESYDS